MASDSVRDLELERLRRRVSELEERARAQDELVAELEAVQEQLRESEQLARVGSWWWDVTTGEVRWSPEVFRIFRLDPDGFTPQIDSILALSPWPEEQQRDQELIERAIASRQGGSYEQRFLRPDGSIGYYVSSFQGLYDGDALTAMRGTVQDITERKEAELALQAREEDLRVTLQSIGDAVIATDIEGRVTRMNPVAEELTGWPIDEARGMPLVDIFPIVNAYTREVVENPVHKVLATNGIVGLANHTVLIRRDGTELQIADSGAPIRDALGQTTGVVLVFRDVTAEYAMEQRLRQAEKLEAIGRLAGGIAHDFNNMLGGIIVSAELLQDYVGASDQGRELLSVVLQSAEAAADLTGKLLAFSRREPSRPARVDVHTVLNDALTILRHTSDRNVKVATDFAAEPSVVEADPTQLQNAFLNLGINAAQAMPRGGTITVTTGVVELTREDCAASAFEIQPGRYVSVAVEDTGHGIPTQVIDRVFEPFFTTKGPQEGTGLGMAAVYGSITSAQGAIEVESEVGRGTRFTVLLPLSADAADQQVAAAEPREGRGCILLVDDEPLIRAATAVLLRRLGYRTHEVGSGEEAVDYFREHGAEVDLVLLDMVMPGMSGRDCFAALQELDPEVKVVLCSGYLRREDVDAMRHHGLLAFLGKPFRAAALSQVLERALEGVPSWD